MNIEKEADRYLDGLKKLLKDEKCYIEHCKYSFIAGANYTRSKYIQEIIKYLEQSLQGGVHPNGVTGFINQFKKHIGETLNIE